MNFVEDIKSYTLMSISTRLWYLIRLFTRVKIEVVPGSYGTYCTGFSFPRCLRCFSARVLTTKAGHSFVYSLTSPLFFPRLSFFFFFLNLFYLVSHFEWPAVFLGPCVITMLFISSCTTIALKRPQGTPNIAQCHFWRVITKYSTDFVGIH